MNLKAKRTDRLCSIGQTKSQVRLEMINPTRYFWEITKEEHLFRQKWAMPGPFGGEEDVPGQAATAGPCSKEDRTIRRRTCFMMRRCCLFGSSGRLVLSSSTLGTLRDSLIATPGAMDLSFDPRWAVSASAWDMVQGRQGKDLARSGSIGGLRFLDISWLF